LKGKIMSVTITWVIEWMSVKPTEGSLTDVVVTAGWRCNGAQTANSVDYTATNYGSASFPAPESTFIPYNQLTQAQVLGWCWANGVDKTAVEEGLQTNIDSQINPTVIQPLLPWATPTA
jgi:hypothetical protein